jgi:hypothetical protein
MLATTMPDHYYQDIIVLFKTSPLSRRLVSHSYTTEITPFVLCAIMKFALVSTALTAAAFLSPFTNAQG